MSSPAVLDAHVHVWDLDRRDQGWVPVESPIRRNFTVADLQSTMSATPVTEVMLVQVINDEEETRDFLALGATQDFVVGVVGWTDLTATDLPDKLAELMADGPLVGIRHQALAEADPAGWLTRPDVQRGIRELTRLGLVFDFMIRPAHFEVALALARANPSQQFVLDHLGKAPIASGQLEPWASGLRQLAGEPNIVCKLSGLMTIADMQRWTYADIEPFTDVALESFGASRLIFGSDWPVSTQAATYEQVYEVAELICAPLSAGEREAFLGGTARSIYRLK